MAELKKFTILTTTHNCLPYVGQCMRSIIAQDYPNWELIVIDDCSKDRTYIRALEITEKYNNIRVVRNDKKLYCGMSYNKALSLATGDYCGVVDGDDVLMPGAISTIMRYYNSNPDVDFIWTKHKWGNTKLDRFKPGLSRSANLGTIYNSENKLKHIYSHWRTFKTSMRDRGVLFRDLKCTVDKDLGYNLERLGPGGFLGLELYKYRYHKGNMSHNSSQKAKWREIRKYHMGKSRYPSRKIKV